MKNSKKFSSPVFFTALLFILFVLHVAVLNPVISSISADIAYEGSYLPLISELALQLVYLACYIVLFAYIALAVLDGGIRRGSKYFFIFIALTVFRYALNIFCTYIFDGGIPSSSDLILSDALDGLFALLLDGIQGAFCLIASSRLLTKAKNKYEAALKWAEKHGDITKAEEFNTLKWENIFSLSNPVQLSLLMSAGLIALIKLLSRAVYDISLTQIEGAPASSEIPLMIAYYLSDIIFGLLIYIGSVTVVWYFGGAGKSFDNDR